MPWKETDLLEAVGKEGIEKEDACVAFVPLEQDVLRLWEKQKRRKKPWKDELEALFREGKNVRSENVSEGGGR